MADQFDDLANLIDHKENLDYDYLRSSFENESVQKFLNCMERNRKHPIQSTYKKRAVKAYEQYDKTKDRTEIDGKLHARFFNSVSNLKDRTIRTKLVGTATIAALLTAGALAITHPSQELPPKQPDVEHFNDLEMNANPTVNNLENNFLQLYAESNFLNKSAENLALDFSNQDYILKINHAGKVRYVSHGNFPNNIENYLKNKDISFQRMRDCKSASIYVTDSNGDLENYIDEFGNPSKIKIDSVAWVRNEETGNIQCIKLFDGNNPTKDGLLDTKEPTATLTNLQKPLEVLSNTTGTNQDILKSDYDTAVQKYQESNILNGCAIENQIDKDLER